ncbi:MAG: hypothetical protein ACXWWR_00040 [Candidatus Limnocylindrales bacterium]
MSADERPRDEVRRRGWLEIRWRQFRNAPRPIVRAVLSPLLVAGVLGLGYLAYDLALARGVALPGGDLRLLAILGYAVGVLASGTVVTYLIVPQPTGSGTRRTRTLWSGALGFFAAVPIAYVVLVVVSQILRPLLA